ncbi:hypothetical protein VQZ30_22445 [Microcystis aeruginosa 1339]
MVDSLYQWWETLRETEKQATEIIQIKMDNGLMGLKQILSPNKT